MKQGATLILLLIIVLSLIFVSGKAKRAGYSGLWDFLSTVAHNYRIGMNAEAGSISIEIKENDLKVLEKNRKNALERGVIINDLDGEFVPATLEYKNKKIKVKLRLKGHMTDHLQDNKWSFRIKVKGDDDFIGMKRFSVQHPGTRGYIYEWIYHEMMRKEGVIALRYEFMNVTVNGKDWGIYAIEENFDKELIENNDRKKGPIMRFNPSLYWVNRYNEMKGIASFDEFASYYSSNPEAYREDEVLGDSVQRSYYLKAIALMEGVRARKISVDRAFDIPRLAKFHAVIDLVGGQHSIDWSDIKYYYNPVTLKLEPVAYESFSTFPLTSLSANYKFSIPDSTQNFADWHSALFSNAVFFKEYMKELERISEKSYLDDFFKTSALALEANLAILYKEFPYKKFQTTQYYVNQERIRYILNTPKAIQAYVTGYKENTVCLQIGTIESLPVEVSSIRIGSARSLNVSYILPAKQKNTYLEYKEFQFKMPDKTIWSPQLADSVYVIYRILGSGKEMTAKAFPFPHTDAGFITEDLKKSRITAYASPLLKRSSSDTNVFVFIKGKITIKEDLVVPPHHILIAYSGTSIDIVNNAKIISYSPVNFLGEDEDPIEVLSSDSSSQGILVLSGTARSTFKNVIFKGLQKIKEAGWNRTGALVFYESPVDFKDCSFRDSKAEDCINIIRSDFSFDRCLFMNAANDALDADFSKGYVFNSVFENCHENAIDITKCDLNLKNINILKAGKGLNIKAGSYVKGDIIRVRSAEVGIAAEDQSRIELNLVIIHDSETGIAAYKKKSGGGNPEFVLTRLEQVNVRSNYLKEKKSSIKVDGIEVEDQKKNNQAPDSDEKKN